jgi:hypothetical protein
MTFRCRGSLCQTQVEIDTEVKRKRSEELIHRFMWELLV